jgi:hypothetical protein
MFPSARATIREFKSSIIRMSNTPYPASHALTKVHPRTVLFTHSDHGTST